MKLFKTIVLLSFLAGCASFENSVFDLGLSVERSMAGFEKHQIQLSDHNWAYLEAGSPADPTVVLLHGFAADKDNWTRMVQKLEGFHVIAPDLPGHGDSSFNDNLQYGFDEQSLRLAEFVDALGLKRFHLVGNSMGGAIAALYAYRHPAKVQSLALLDAAGFYGEQPSELQILIENKQKNPLIVRSPEDMEFLMSFAMEQVPFLPWPASNVLARRAMAKEAANDQIFKHMMIEAEAAKLSGGFTHVFSKLTVPSLVLWGEEDRILHVSSVDKFFEAMPNVQTEILPNVGHAPMLEVPELTANLLVEFWQQDLKITLAGAE
jgi:abhydrolase domain-containing protein 6